MEAMSHNNAVRKCIEQSQQQSKRKSDDKKPSFKESLKYRKQSAIKNGFIPLKGLRTILLLNLLLHTKS
jgi:hypothetical protein